MGRWRASLSRSLTSVEKTDFPLGAFCAAGTFQVLCDNEASDETDAIRIENTSELSPGDWANFLTPGAQGAFQKRTATSSIWALAFHSEGTDDRWALYTQGEFTWNGALTLVPGLRFQQVHQSSGAAAAAAGGKDTIGTAVSPKLAALYPSNPV